MDSNSINGHTNGTRLNGYTQYSVPDEATKVFQTAILNNPLISKDLPKGINEAVSKIHFTGSPDPSLPINYRFAEAVSSLKALEASLVNVLISRKHSVPVQDVTINTDHATLFIMSAALWTIDPGGLNITALGVRGPNAEIEKFFPSGDIYRSHATLHRRLATNIYRCKDGRYFNLHGDMNSDPALECIGLPAKMETESFEEGVERYEDAVGKMESGELQRLCTDVYGQSGTICYSVEESRESEHGRANKDPACWWPDIKSTGVQRPLAGLKVVDLTRVIAAPAVTRGLAELGASVMRCTSPNLPDVTGLHPDLNWGKWNCSTDLKDPADREKLRALIMDADIVVQGYRPGSLEKHGFGQQDIIDMCKDRERGIISVRENCYGWHGPWSHRSGWQQVSDANVGVSMGFGRAMGHGEPVQPIFPHADYCTGISGTCAILIALLRRAEKGDSYAIDLALNYYSAWLVNSVGEYPREVFEKVWTEHGKPVWRHYHHNVVTGPATMKTLRAGEGGKRLLKPEFFQDRSATDILGNRKFRHIRPIAQWPAGTVEPGYRIGTRGNRVDAARWPEDLSVEVVV